jgi:pSer/pThr/pTyr-binding forkhead associated (FHA) protein
VGSRITVGRNPDNVIVLNDPQVSSYHMIFSIQTEGVVVWDNNSTNGTYLNGILLTGYHRLTTSDVLQVGAVILRLTTN